MPAVVGLNIPEELTPGPDQVPPIFAAVNCVEVPPVQKGPAGLIAELGVPACAEGAGAIDNV